MSIVIYTSSNCPNCTRLLATLRRIPSLAGKASVVEVGAMDPNRLAAQGITAVPTIVAQGRPHVGKAAFEYLSQFNDELEIESVSLGTGALAYGSIGSEHMEWIEKYGEFTAPP
jgi:glutaredoxin